MISLMLSSQTKDEVTAGAMNRLKKFGLTPKNVADTDESVLAQLIHPVGFWQVKIYIFCGNNAAKVCSLPVCVFNVYDLGFLMLQCNMT